MIKCRLVRLNIALLISLMVLVGSAVEARRDIPDDNLAYPVLISLKNGSQGTGFFFAGETTTYLVTARHVLLSDTCRALRSDSATLLCYAVNPTDTNAIMYQIDLRVLQTAGNIRCHSTRDIAAVGIGVLVRDSGQVMTKFFEGVRLTQHRGAAAVIVERETLAPFDSVLVGNEAVVFGYPSSLGSSQLEHMRPLLRRGVIAGKNYRNSTIVIDCPVYGGNSGGPVLQIEHESATRYQFRVIGIAVEFVPFVERWMNLDFGYTNRSVSNSGYSIIEPVDFLLEILNDGGKVDNKIH